MAAPVCEHHLLPGVPIDQIGYAECSGCGTLVHAATTHASLPTATDVAVEWGDEIPLPEEPYDEDYAPPVDFRTRKPVEAPTEATGVRHVRLVSAANPAERKTLSVAILRDRRRFDRVHG